MVESNFFMNCIEEANKTSFEDVSDGIYRMRVTDVKEVPTSTCGVRLQCAFTVQEGEFEGAVVQTSFNIVNKSEKAQQIGRQQLGKLYIAMGINAPKSFEQLKNHDITAEVFHETYNGKTYPRVKNFKVFEAPKAEEPEVESSYNFG